MPVITKDKGIIYEFSRKNHPIISIPSRSTITIEAYDCFKNQIDSPKTVVSDIDWKQINPATGPIFVEGASPGDILKVKIEKIDLSTQGVMVVGPNLGVMGHRITEMEAKIIPIVDGKAKFNDLNIPLNPMVGVIGVAPAGESVNCGTPGSHGGNMDNKMVAEGATLYFPVFTEGALFALGDCHAAMGDGEISVSGIEIPANVTVTLEVIKGASLQHPMLENDEVFTQIVSAPTLDAACKEATEVMADLLVAKTGLTLSEVTMLLSTAGQVEVCQMVDPLMTARFSIPKYLLDQLNIKQLF
ncbi:acetamidase/formamidase family protein [Cytobacillus horneckiae]|uniref:acetamidase/formamidase family protein n=1 Tax=Cytobacillus horneckiae TaxID=549687 RepID=UPI00203D0C1C|nr:acetamidase/formamidase family protein [Cytobacillus horneckiae]MCM3178021.1 acetamidase/formamidase family protein [Cytobacillus horneckiae]